MRAIHDNPANHQGKLANGLQLAVLLFDRFVALAGAFVQTSISNISILPRVYLTIPAS